MLIYPLSQYVYIHMYKYIYIESASECRPVFFDENKRFLGFLRTKV